MCSLNLKLTSPSMSSQNKIKSRHGIMRVLEGYGNCKDKLESAKGQKQVASAFDGKAVGGRNGLLRCNSCGNHHPCASSGLARKAW